MRIQAQEFVTKADTDNRVYISEQSKNKIVPYGSP